MSGSARSTEAMEQSAICSEGECISKWDFPKCTSVAVWMATKAKEEEGTKETVADTNESTEPGCNDDNWDSGEKNGFVMTRPPQWPRR
mmetsp:Transcript_26812/g.56617  ORF Transcript_26812/g.56617 Transcript_26812/m.56617 type:complete len:88 (-) Transcript_26812:460-723(-)